jgi:hypothetical protein
MKVKRQKEIKKYLFCRKAWVDFHETKTNFRASVARNNAAGAAFGYTRR